MIDCPPAVAPAHRRSFIRVALVTLLALLLSACGSASEVAGGDGGGPAAGGGDGADGSVRMARASWDTGFMQAEIYRQLLTELGYDVSDPADATMVATQFYPALARGDFDFWANGWFPLHEIFLQRQLVTGQESANPVTPVGTQVPAGALQGYLVDAASAEELGITSMSDFTRAAVAEVFDTDGNGAANLVGCNEGWGCNEAINDHIDQLDWGSNVEQIVGDYPDLFAEVVERVESGEPTLFYTWTPNWTIDVLTPGEDVVWLESPALPDDEGRTEVEDLDGCAAELPCDLGWVVNDIRVVANDDFLEANPQAEALFEAVQIPQGDIAAQNAEMQEAGDGYTDQDVADAAAEWIEANRSDVDAWLEEARAAG